MAPRGPFAASPSSLTTLETGSSKQSSTKYEFYPFARTGLSSTSASDVGSVAGSVRSGRSVGSRSSGTSRSSHASGSRRGGTTPRQPGLRRSASTPFAAGSCEDRAGIEQQNVHSEESLSVDSRLLEQGVREDSAFWHANADISEDQSCHGSQSDTKANKVEHNHCAGIKEGYFGVLPPRTVTNKRLFGLNPCMRSCVDEVVFGRDMDGSTNKDQSAEMQHLLSMFAGAAGGHRKAPALLIDNDEVPDAPEPPCLRPAQVIEADGLDGYAGLATCPRKQVTKRVWSRLPQQRSTVAEVVFGQEKAGFNEKDASMVEQFERSAGKSPRFVQSDARVKQGSPHHDLKQFTAKRNYHHAPMNKAQMERLVNNAEVRPASPEVAEYIAKQFEGAAGLSSRFAMERGTRRCKSAGPSDPKYCVYMQPVSSIGRS